MQGAEAGYSAHVIKARQSVGKRSQNRTINDNPQGQMTNQQMLQMNQNAAIKTIDLNVMD